MSRWIDAEWLLNFFEPYPDDYQTPLGSLRACVDDAPSIDIEPKRGEWIEPADGERIAITGRCSNCGWEAHLLKDDVVGMPFCPNCGADMKGLNDDY